MFWIPSTPQTRELGITTFVKALNGTVALADSVYTCIHATFSYSYDDATVMQKAMRNVKWAPVRPSASGHTHGEAAALRFSAAMTIADVVADAGMQQYIISPAGRDSKLPGVRMYHTAKDEAQPARLDPEPARCVYVMHDVDYYLTPYQFDRLLGKGKPILSYTFCPFEPAGTVYNGTYTSANNCVRVNIMGGAQYEHELWDYEMDHLVHRGWFFDTLFFVEKRVDPNDHLHQIICMVPVKSVFHWFGCSHLPGKTLKRRIFSEGDFNKMDFLSECQTENGKICKRFTSLSMAGSTAVCTLPEEVMKVVVLKALRPGVKETALSGVEGAIRTWMSGKTMNFDKSGWAVWSKCGDPTIRAAICVACVESNPSWFAKDLGVTSLPCNDPAHYTPFVPTRLLEEPKPTMRLLVPTSSSFLGTGTSPTSCASSDEVCIKKRVLEPRNPEKPVSAFYFRCRDEFNARVVPEERVHTGIPASLEEVSRNQPRPNQQRLFKLAIAWLYNELKATISSFQKREASSGFKPPRNISPVNPNTKARASMFMYAISKILSKMPFYAFSKTPKELEEVLNLMLSTAKEVIPTDFSTFDGTHSRWLGESELLLYKRYFAEEYHEELESLFKSLNNATGKTRFGIVYDTGHSRPSGAPGTSTDNTYDNALCAYIVLRTAYKDKDADWCFQHLGIYGGDDGLTPDVSKEVYEKVATNLGLKLKAQTVARDHPVPFLGRVFIGPWGAQASIADVPRQLGKLHMTTAMDAPAWLVVHRKAAGFLLTDPQTPILSEWAHAVLRCVQYRKLDKQLDGYENQLSQDQTWFSKYSNDDQFTPCDPNLAAPVIADALGVPTEFVGYAQHRLASLSKRSLVPDLFFRIADPPLEVRIDCTSGDTFYSAGERNPDGKQPSNNKGASGGAGPKSKNAPPNGKPVVAIPPSTPPITQTVVDESRVQAARPGAAESGSGPVLIPLPDNIVPPSGEHVEQPGHQGQVASEPASTPASVDLPPPLLGPNKATGRSSKRRSWWLKRGSRSRPA